MFRHFTITYLNTCYNLELNQQIEQMAKANAEDICLAFSEIMSQCCVAQNDRLKSDETKMTLSGLVTHYQRWFSPFFPF